MLNKEIISAKSDYKEKIIDLSAWFLNKKNIDFIDENDLRKYCSDDLIGELTGLTMDMTPKDVFEYLYSEEIPVLFSKYLQSYASERARISNKLLKAMERSAEEYIIESLVSDINEEIELQLQYDDEEGRKWRLRWREDPPVLASHECYVPDSISNNSLSNNEGV